MSKPGSKQELVDLKERCHRQGMELTEIEQKGTVLVLHPRPGTSLLDAAQMAQVADAVEVPNIRYVTIDLAGFGAAQARRPGASDE